MTQSQVVGLFTVEGAMHASTGSYYYEQFMVSYFVMANEQIFLLSGTG